MAMEVQPGFADLQVVCTEGTPQLIARFQVSDATAEFLATLPENAEPYSAYTAFLTRRKTKTDLPYQVRMLLQSNGGQLVFYAEDEFEVYYDGEGKPFHFLARLENLSVVTAPGRLPGLIGTWGVSEGWGTSVALARVGRVIEEFPSYDAIEIAVGDPTNDDTSLWRRIEFAKDPSSRAFQVEAIDSFLSVCGPSVSSGGGTGILR
ncbi:MAG: hypothetical protein AAGA71_19635 [Pseudomonadota bacterium]